jgi:hypothetical protein
MWIPFALLGNQPQISGVKTLNARRNRLFPALPLVSSLGEWQVRPRNEDWATELA